MHQRFEFQHKINAHLETIDPKVLAYNKDEYWMILYTYELLEFYARERSLWNTSIALPLSRGLHDGTYRKSTMSKNGSTYRIPYVFHCLRVCRMLADLNIPISRDEEDILLAAALCHDMIEDLPFTNGGRELIDDYGLDPRVYDVVKLVSKRKDFTAAEEQEHFRFIQENKLALLVKLSDRSHNVEDLYNMSIEKVHEYVYETERFILPMCEYGLEHYPDVRTTLGILKDKILCLTGATAIMIRRYEEREQELRTELKALRVENDKLNRAINKVWDR